LGIGLSKLNVTANFGSSIFSGDACFKNSVFNGNSYFEDAVFNGTADFHECTFNGYAYFGDVILYVFSWRVLPLAFGDYPVLSVPMLPVLS